MDTPSHKTLQTSDGHVTVAGAVALRLRRVRPELCRETDAHYQAAHTLLDHPLTQSSHQQSKLIRVCRDAKSTTKQLDGLCVNGRNHSGDVSGVGAAPEHTGLKLADLRGTNTAESTLISLRSCRTLL